MGADLCGWIVIMPATFSKRREARTRSRLKLLKRTAEELEALFAQGKEPDADRDDFQLVYGQEQQFTLEESAHELAALDVEEFIGRLRSVWKEEYRDCMSRGMPGRGKRFILACGERTYGDGPEDNSAWGVVDRAAKMGLFPLLDIE